MAAAGLYNPVTGRKMVKTWNADELFPYLEDFYQQIEQFTHSRFLYPKPIYRPFVSVAEQNDWLAKADNKAFAPYVEKVATSSLFPDALYDDWGGILLKRSGYLDVPAYLQASQTFFNSIGAYQEDKLDWSALNLENDYVQYKGQKARCIISSEGPQATANPYFKWLPFRPVKGEILFIKPEKAHEVVFNRGIFVLPIGEISKIGSTYDHENLDSKPSDKGRAYLEEKLQKLCKLRYTLSAQTAGVRPATQDRKPFIGIHPEHKLLAIFNGLGTKGVSLAPYYARQFVDHLLEAASLDQEVDIKRFYHLHNSALK